MSTHRAAERKAERVVAMADEGYTYHSIARVLGITEPTIAYYMKTRAKRYNNTERRILSAWNICDFFGASKRFHDHVVYWIDHGWLQAITNQNGMGTQIHRRVSIDSLITFMEDQRYWYAWKPDRIRDNATREWAREMRAAGPQWHDCHQIASIYYVSWKTVLSWKAAGLLTGWITYFGKIYINDADLAGFIPPCEQPRRRAA